MLSNEEMNAVQQISAIIGEDKTVAPVVEQKKKPVAEKPQPVEVQDNGADDGDEPEEMTTEEVDIDLSDDDVSDSQDDTPPEPVVAAPVGFNAEEKAFFASLPPETQKAVARRERERDKAIQKAQRETADLRKSIETERQSLTAERSNLSQQAQRWVNDKEAAFLKEFSDVQSPLALATSDPVRFTRYQAAIAEIQSARIEAQRAAEAQAQEDNRKLADYRKEQNELLSEKLKLDTPEKFEKFDSEITAYARKHGITDAQLGRSSAVAIEMAYKAMKWDQAMARRQAAEKKQTTTPAPFVKPGAKADVSVKEEQRTASMKRLRKTGSVDDAATVLKAMGL